jgi:hypothetical protein
MYFLPFFEVGSLEKHLLYEDAFQVVSLWMNYATVIERNEGKQPYY